MNTFFHEKYGPAVLRICRAAGLFFRGLRLIIARKSRHYMLFTWFPREFTKESLGFPALFYLDFT